MVAWIFLILALITQNGRRDFYGILGVPNDATQRVIEKAYQVLSRKYHPDKYKGKDDKFGDINDAYAVLRDQNKRRIFDIYGESGVHILDAPTEGIGKSMVNGVEDELTKNIKRKAKTVHLDFPIDLIDFYEGRTYPVHLTRRVMCRCPTKGFVCPKCRGKPTMRENINLTLVVERGCDADSPVLFKNSGDVSPVNAPGDIEIKLVEKKHPFFRRVGSDLHIDIDITLKEALLGFTRTYKHIDGKEFTIESGPLQDFDDVTVIKDRGMPKYMYPGEFGDIIVHSNVKWPTNLTADQKAKLSEALRSD